MARHTTDARDGGGRMIMIVAVALFLFWAGHDPAGALALIHRVAEGIASAANAASHASNKK